VEIWNPLVRISSQRVACERVTVGWVVRERGHPILSSCGELLDIYIPTFSRGESARVERIDIYYALTQRVACERVAMGWVVRERGHPILSSCGKLLELPTSSRRERGSRIYIYIYIY
jgi:hypothetical protein